MNYGTVSYSEPYWRIRCEPQVRARLKRLFPQVKQHAAECIALSDSDENCRDLLWFLERYPMEVRDLARLQAGATKHVERGNIIQELLQNRRPPAQFDLAEPAREYQRVAADLAMVRGGLLVADEVGLGKTYTSICPMVLPQHLPALVVTLPHLLKQWREQLNRFAPVLTVHTLRTGRPYDLVPKKRRKDKVDPRLPDVILTNYHKLHGWSDVLAGLIRYIVFDEIQELRRQDSLKYAAASFIADKAQLRMGLSATPIYNYGREFHNVIDVLLRGVLGTSDEFVREWCSSPELIADPEVFGAYLRREGIMLRRSRKDVGRELPRANIIPYTIEADASVLQRIRGSAVELAQIILSSQQSYRGQKFRAAEEFNIMMRQATGIAKAPFVAEFVRLLIESGESVMLYGWHREVYAIWQDLLKDFNPVMFTGTESPAQKEASKQAFLSRKSKVMLISLRAGAGMDGCQKVCRTVVFGELDWSDGVHTQCIGRVRRDDQEDPVMAYFLMSDEGSDPIMVDVLGLKKTQIEGVIDPSGAKVEKLDVDQGNMKRLAQDFLRRLGIHPSVPAESKPAEDAVEREEETALA